VDGQLALDAFNHPLGTPSFEQRQRISYPRRPISCCRQAVVMMESASFRSRTANAHPDVVPDTPVLSDIAEVTLGIIAFIILGLLAGAIAKAVLPGDDPGGFIITALIGIAGALLGGFLAAALFDAHPLDEFFDVSTWLIAIIGSIVLLLLYRLVVGRGRTGRLA
jgi:uncharacterized membrane protein YeaQ/YmgE (transglycosylase-associated protein family)